MSESSARNPSLTNEQIAKITDTVATALRKVSGEEPCCGTVEAKPEDPCCVSVEGGKAGSPRVLCICIDSKGERE